MLTSEYDLAENHAGTALPFIFQSATATTKPSPSIDKAVIALWTHGFYEIPSESTSPVVWAVPSDDFPSDKMWDEVNAILQRIWAETDYVSIEEDDAYFDAMRSADIERYKDLYGDIDKWE